MSSRPDPMSLRYLSAGVLARSACFKINDCFLREMNNNDYSSFVNAIKETLAPWAQLPSEVWPFVVSELFKYSLYAGYIVSFVHALHLERIPQRGYLPRPEQWIQMAGPLSFPSSLLASLASRLPHTVTYLNLYHFTIDDEFMHSLSRSGCAETLRKLNIQHGDLSDASAAFISQFSQLRTLRMRKTGNFGLPLLQSISQLKNLEVLLIDTNNVSERSVLSTLLAPESLPSLRRLIRTGESKEWSIQPDILIATLEKRPNRDSIEEITVSIATPEMATNLIQLLPNLRIKSTGNMPADPEEIDEVASHVAEISLGMWEFRPSTPQHVVSAAKKLKYLERFELTMSDSFRGAMALDLFRNLKVLSINELNSFDQITFPINLKELKISIDATKDPAALDRLLDSLCVPHLGESLVDLQLRSLKLTFTVSQIQRILSSLQSLQTLSLGVALGSLPAQEELIHLSHPSLRQLPTIHGMNIQFVPSWMPSLNDLSIYASTARSVALERQRPRKLQFGAKLSLGPDNISPALFRYSQVLSLSSFGSGDAQSNLSFFADMKNLLRLDFGGLEVNLQGLRFILDSLPLLCELVAPVDFTADERISLKHHNLTSINLFTTFPAPVIDKNTPTRANVDFSGEDLPNLRVIVLKLPDVVASVRVSGFERLETAYVVRLPTPDYAAALSVENCPRLRELILTAHISSLRLKDLPSLRMLFFRKCSLAADFDRAAAEISLPSRTLVLGPDEMSKLCKTTS